MTYILYNPLAGNGSGAEEAKKLSTRYEGEVICADMTTLGGYTELLSTLGAEDRILICGGDGTINRFVNDTESMEIPCELLYYAVGTGNDFLKDLGKETGCDPFDLKPYIKDLPFVEVNGKKHRFLNGIGFGIDGYCCEEGDKQKAAGKKDINYTAIAIKGLLFKFKPRNATVTVDGRTFTYKKAWIAASMKGRYYGGGMMTAPDQDRLAEDGEMTLVLMYGKGKIKTLTVFPSIFKGEHVKHTEMVAVHTGKEITVTFETPCALQIDGETVLNVKEYRVNAGVKASAEAEPATV
jgi:diacylglycerol kinase family enzyme